jgi:hypothetical protein
VERKDIMTQLTITDARREVFKLPEDLRHGRLIDHDEDDAGLAVAVRDPRPARQRARDVDR